MATPNPTDIPMNHRPMNERTLGQFIRMKQVPKKGKKPNLGIKKLINRFENRPVTGEQIQGSVLATPSAPSYEEEDSDCVSWGSDFDEDENTEDLPWEPQEEIENGINDMLEAAMERNKKLQNEQVGRNETVQTSPSRSDSTIPPEGRGFPTGFNAPPLPPRNINPTPPLNHINKTPENPQTKSPTQVVTPPVPRLPTVSVPSTSACRAPTGPTRSESSLQTPSQQATPRFPPDVTNIPNNSPTSFKFPLASSLFTAAKRTSPVLEREAIITSNSDASNPTNDLQFGNPRGAKVTPELRTVASSRPKGPNETSTPPPLPARPPPVRPRVNTPATKSSPTHPASPASTSKVRNDTPAFKNSHPRQPLPYSASKIITKDSSPSMTNVLDSLQNSSVSESLKPVSSPGECLSTHDVRLPEKPSTKSKSIALGVPKILKELDVALLKQTISKKRDKSASFTEMRHSLEETRSCSSFENSAKAENTFNSQSEDYLNPKELKESGPQFVPDRPTLPRRLKHARSLPLLNLIDTLKKDPSKNKISADEQNRLKLCQQPAQAVNVKSEHLGGLLAANDEVFRQPWYHPVTWTQAQFKLTTMAQDGAFLVRPSSRSSEGVPFTISVFFRGRIINCHISSTPEGKCVLGKLKPNQKAFDTITELIRFYQSTPAELKIGDSEPVSRVCLLITPPKDADKIYVDV